ncbi:hypothetical protein F5H01DRAFT_323695 [Linnemannia elongata]|nr:hypothetical protein F5H01DRAFT_323695 [Linnemannia elongata]
MHPTLYPTACSFHNCHRDEPVKGTPSHVEYYHSDQDIKVSVLGLEFTFKRESGGERNYVCLCGLRMNSPDKVVYHCRLLELEGVMKCQALELKANGILLGNNIRESENPIEHELNITKSSITEQEELEALFDATEEALWKMEQGWKINKYPQGKVQQDIENAFAYIGHHREVQKSLVMVAYGPIKRKETVTTDTTRYHEASNRIEVRGCYKYINGKVVYGPLTEADTIKAEAWTRRCML